MATYLWFSKQGLYTRPMQEHPDVNAARMNHEAEVIIVDNVITKNRYSIKKNMLITDEAIDNLRMLTLVEQRAFFQD